MGMLPIDRLFGLSEVQQNQQSQRLEKPDKGISWLEVGGGFDTVSFSTNKGEKFADVRAEMDKNVPDRTTTIEEKESAISYIDRMLECSDITPEMKNYWTNKKNVIEMEIQSIKNEQTAGSGEKIEDVWKEFSEFTNKYFNSINDNMTMEEKYENRVAYYNMYRTFIARFMNCSDITEEQRAEYSQMEYNANHDLSNWERDFERYKNS